jgi:RsiW-degrading membrane proteinase PrsW (M82 family)
MDALGVLTAIAMGFGPMIVYAIIVSLFDRYEKEPWWLVIGAFVWGAVVAAGASLVLNTLFGESVAILTNDEFLADTAGAVISAPLVEETFKGLAVVAILLFFRHEFDSLLDGVIYGALVGFGFAATENVAYILRGYADGGFGGLLTLTIIRAVGIAFLHASLTACAGLGLAAFRLGTSRLRYAWPVVGYAAAILFHFLHNATASIGNELLCVLGLAGNWIGYLGLFLFMAIMVWREGRIMRRQLADEVGAGLISQQEYATATSLLGQASARAAPFSSSGRFFDLLGELAFRKNQLETRGANREPEAPRQIAQLRSQIAGLRR